MRVSIHERRSSSSLPTESVEQTDGRERGVSGGGPGAIIAAHFARAGRAEDREREDDGNTDPASTDV